MRVSCSHCRSQVEIGKDTQLSHIVCSACGKQFSLALEETATLGEPIVELPRPEAHSSDSGRYELLEPTEAGAASEVWKAKDTSTNRVVAVKFLRSAQSSVAQQQLLEWEAKMAGLLNHPHVVSVLGGGVIDGKSCIVSEYIEGERLDEYCSGKRLSPRDAAAICSKIAHALYHVHQQGIIHRDVNPKNIIIDEKGDPHIFDFGLASRVGHHEGLPEGVLVGTPAYLSPEQARGEHRKVDHRADIFSLGVILFELLTGQRPFLGEKGRNVLFQIIHDEPPIPSLLRNEIPSDVEATCRKCLAKDPRDRFASALDVASELDRFLIGDYRAELHSLRLDLVRRTDMFIATKAEHQLYESLVESLPLCVFRKDLDGRFVFANEYFCKTVSRSAVQVRGATSHDLFSTSLALKQQAEDRRVVATGKVIESTEEHPSDNGESTFFEVVKFPVRNFKGDITHVQGLMWDVSARTRVEKALRQARDAAEDANRAKSFFLANMSHEMRTPMSVVLGITELLLKKPMEADHHRWLGMAHESAASLLGIMDEILDFSKIEAGRVELRPETFNLRDMMDHVVMALGIRAQEKGLAVTCHVAKEAPSWVRADPLRLRQVMTNLVANAIKFTDHGHVAVRADLESLSDDKHSVRLHFSVSDTGIGIPQEKLGLIFRPFEQADGSITRRYGGTGLGLALSQRLVELMGGDIQVESDVCVGSVFRFVIDVRIGEEVVSEKEHESIDGSDILEILLVEDHVIMQEFGVHALESAGHRVSTANNGKEAVALLARRRFDVVLMDVQMPVMDGLQATAEIRKQERENDAGGRVPIIAMTAHAMSGDRQQCLDAGMDGYLTKPIKVQDLLLQLGSTIRAVADRPQQENERSSTTRTPCAFDAKRLLDRVGGDRSFLHRAVTMFQEDYVAMCREIQASLVDQDLRRLGAAAHKLIGIIRNFDGVAASEAAAKLEYQAEQKDLIGASTAWSALQREVQTLLSELHQFVSH